MDGGAWSATVCGVTEESDVSGHTFIHSTGRNTCSTIKSNILPESRRCCLVAQPLRGVGTSMDGRDLGFWFLSGRKHLCCFQSRVLTASSSLKRNSLRRTKLKVSAVYNTRLSSVGYSFTWGENLMSLRDTESSSTSCPHGQRHIDYPSWNHHF